MMVCAMQDLRLAMGQPRLCHPVNRHVYRHVCRHVYRHTHRQAPGMHHSAGKLRFGDNSNEYPSLFMPPCHGHRRSVMTAGERQIEIYGRGDMLSQIIRDRTGYAMGRGPCYGPWAMQYAMGHVTGRWLGSRHLIACRGLQ